MPARNLRRYEPIWLQLKATKRAEVKCDPTEAKTIIDAVKKEKVKDATKEVNQLIHTTILIDRIIFTLRHEVSINNV